MALDSTELPQSIVERQLMVPAIRRVSYDYSPPLDLEAKVFRYLQPRGVRVCRSRHSER